MDDEKIKFETGILGNLLVWDPDGPDALIKYQLHLLMRQRPDYLLPCFLRYQDNMSQLCLDTAGLKPLDQALTASHLNPESGRALIAALLEKLIDAEDRMLPIKQFSLHPSLVFLNQDEKIRLAFWPALSATPEDGSDGPYQALLEFLRFAGLASKIPSDEIELYQYKLKQEGLLALFQQMTAEQDIQPQCEISAASQTRRHPEHNRKLHGLKAGQLILLSILHLFGIGAAACGYLAHAAWSDQVIWALLIYIAVLLILDAFFLFRQSSKKPIQTIGQIIVRLKSLELMKWLKHWHGGQQAHEPSEPDAQTVLLSANPADFRMALLSEGMPGTLEENEGIRAYILIDEFIIGRDPKFCDLHLDDPGVGRQHARIIRRAGSFFICDLGSRNGTSLDGKKINKNQETLLPDQCKISFADRTFNFQAD